MRTATAGILFAASIALMSTTSMAAASTVVGQGVAQPATTTQLLRYAEEHREGWRERWHERRERWRHRWEERREHWRHRHDEKHEHERKHEG